MKSAIGIYGAGGFGRVVLPLVRAQRPDLALLFIDDGTNLPPLVNGHPALAFHALQKSDYQVDQVVLAMANSKLRQKLASRCLDAGMSLPSIFASNVVMLDEVEVSDGAILCPFVTITSNVRIGRCFHANIYSYVEHDCVIGDYVTFAPGAKCNGNVVIGDHAYIGAGAVLRQGIPGRPLQIGAGAVIGMGAVVTKDVPPGVTVIGNPARIMERKNNA